ncbi:MULTISPECIES: sulfite exporter TauE/SafE family protein [unclassified Yoonia]|uniref:sulfite exporter TauE/SafE family protein n=1 Tax=unclassified Yoonia TaxID=2629118 RepID=UPI002AFDFE8A|nr:MULTISPECIES: sulfite exporter TauE/SafE family protein [unclassified Yoonia]
MEPQTLVFLTLALAAGAITKGATGMGLPLIALPLLTAAVGLQQAIGIMLIPVLLTNAYQVWSYRDVRTRPGVAFLPGFLIGGAIGVTIGTWALDALPERSLEIGLGVLLLTYVALRLARPEFTFSAAFARRAGPAIGLAAGTLQGATGIAAPIGVTFIHALGLERRATVFAVSVMFLGFAMVQYPAIIFAGIYQLDWLLLGLFACVPILIFMPLGEWLGRRASPQLFARLILVFLCIAGLGMVFKF